MAFPTRRTAVLAVLAALPLIGCATTMGSGVAPARLDRPPYYAGDGLLPASAVVAHASITYQLTATGPGAHGPSGRAGSAVAGLLAEMNAYLDELGVSASLSLDGVRGRPPDVRFGCLSPGRALCDMAVPGGDRRARPEHWLDVTRPSGAWVDGVARALEAAGATHILVLHLELSEYWPRALLPVPILELGTDHHQELRWYTDTEAPVQVLQLTGALLDAEGRALRIGAEGLTAATSGLVMTLLAVQRTIGERDVEWLRTAHRDDLPGQPLVWATALRTLVTRLLGAAAQRDLDAGRRELDDRVTAVASTCCAAR
jgi:hypothetical protein